MKAKTIKLKGQSLKKWKAWIENELAPPPVVSGPSRYVIEALLEAIELLEKKNVS